jgi:hypothetical protein
MYWVGFETTIPALDLAATVIGSPTRRYIILILIASLNKQLKTQFLLKSQTAAP